MSLQNGTLSAWIDDGYERDGYVAPIPGIHPGLKFRFRPAMSETRHIYRRRFASNPRGEDEAAFIAETIAKQVTSWEGRAKVDLDGAKRLQTLIADSAFDQILGLAAPDKRQDEELASAKNS